MITKIPYDWTQSTERDFTSEHRFYIDPRGVEYPPISGTPAYSEVSGVFNRPGRYTLTSALTYIFTPSTSFSFEIGVEQALGGTTLSNLARFLGGYTITLRHDAAGTYSLVLVGGSTVTLTGGVTQPGLQRIGFTLNYGGAVELYVDGVSVDTDTAPALTTNPTTLEINGSANCFVSYARLFNGYAATDANHLSAFDHVGNEEIFFTYNKTAYGRTRCNVNRVNNNLVDSFTINHPSGYSASNASITLNNLSGEFSADQFATYAPEVGSYNGTSSQNYLARKVGLEIETWSPTAALYPATTLYPSATLYPLGGPYTFETIFRGWIPQGSFSRATAAYSMSSVALSAEDAIPDIARKIARTSYKWENYYLSRATPSSNSVFHEIAYLATRREVKNYATNACFENTTIGNSWATDGTLTRGSTTVLQGTYSGVFTGTNKIVYQYVNFANSEDSLNVGDTFTSSIYVYSASAISGKIKTSERTASAEVASTEVSYTHGGKGWEKWSAQHTVTSSTSVRIGITLTSTGAWTSVPIDCAMVKRGSVANMLVNNTNDGSSGVSTASQAVSSYYDFIGIDVDDISYIHPWAWLQKGENILENLQELASAVCARVFDIDTSGVLRLRSGISTNPPASLGSISKVDSLQSEVAMGPNIIKISGLKVYKDNNPSCVWMAKASSLKKKSGDASGEFTRTLANGDTIPSFAEDEVVTFEAKYGTVRWD